MSAVVSGPDSHSSVKLKSVLPETQQSNKYLLFSFLFLSQGRQVINSPHQNQASTQGKVLFSLPLHGVLQGHGPQMSGLEDEPSCHRRVVSVFAALPGREFIRVAQKIQFTSPSLCSCQFPPAHQTKKEGKALPLLWNQVIFEISSNPVVPRLVDQREV